MMRAVALGVLTLTAGGVAQAFSVSQTNGHDIEWSTNNLTYWVDTTGAPGLGAQSLPAVDTAAGTWNAVSCTSLHLTKAGMVTGVQPFLVSNKTDGKNIVTWVTNFPFDARTLAVTTPVYNSTTGTIVEADIALNGGNGLTWTLTVPITQSSVADVQSVVTHEMGHFFGLQHVLGGQDLPQPPVMSPYLDPTGGTRVPKADDINGVCYLYPKSPPYSCSTIDDCPSILAGSSGTEVYTGRIDCQSSRCSGIVGVSSTPGALGSLCQSASDCNSGLSCTPFGGTSNCTESCTPSSSTACPTSFECVSLSGTASGACFPAAVTGNCACDTGPACQASCVCDPDCAKCACDKTTSCDSNCSCDPDCGGGCAAEAARDGSSRNGIGAALLFAAFVFLFARAKRRRHGGARSGDV